MTKQEGEKKNPKRTLQDFGVRDFDTLNDTETKRTKQKTFCREERDE